MMNLDDLPGGSARESLSRRTLEAVEKLARVVDRGEMSLKDGFFTLGLIHEVTGPPLLEEVNRLIGDAFDTWKVQEKECEEREQARDRSMLVSRYEHSPAALDEVAF